MQVPTTGKSPFSNFVTGLPPSLYSSRYTFPSRLISTIMWLDSAFTTDAPTPCRPPETLYTSLLNLPPACNTVYTTRAVGIFFVGWMSTGTPRPLSSTTTPPSFNNVKWSSLQNPARCSSIPLSRISHIIWWRPLVPVLPIYIPGRLRTASNPSKITISLPL